MTDQQAEALAYLERETRAVAMVFDEGDPWRSNLLGHAHSLGCACSIHRVRTREPVVSRRPSEDPSSAKVIDFHRRMTAPDDGEAS
jgi:hypothetical protein